MTDNDDEQRYAALAAAKSYPSLPEDFAGRFVPRALAARRRERARRFFWRGVAAAACLALLAAGAALSLPRGQDNGARKRPAGAPPQVAALAPARVAQPPPALPASSRPEEKIPLAGPPAVQETPVPRAGPAAPALAADSRQEKEKMERKDVGKMAAAAIAAVSFAAPASAFRFTRECAGSAASGAVALEARALAADASQGSPLDSRVCADAVSPRVKLKTTKWQGFVIMLK